MQPRIPNSNPRARARRAPAWLEPGQTRSRVGAENFPPVLDLISPLGEV